MTSPGPNAQCVWGEPECFSAFRPEGSGADVSSGQLPSVRHLLCAQLCTRHFTWIFSHPQDNLQGK